MELKRAKVIMLPTKRSNIVVNKRMKQLQYNDIDYLQSGELQPQHLYFTTDDEIKENDWVYNSKENIIEQVVNKETLDFVLKHNDLELIFFRVSYTTDESLKLPCTCMGMSDKVKCDWMCKTHQSYMLPQPSKAFIEKYCKLGGIDEVYVEYVDRYDIKYSYIPGFGETAKRIDLPNELKVNSYNEITIHPIKDSWTREEVENLLMQAWIHGEANTGVHYTVRENWIKENLTSF